jgi:hypothetical protein
MKKKNAPTEPATYDNLKASAELRCSALLAEAALSKMMPDKAMQFAEDFCKYESWGLDCWREPMTVLAAEVARLQSANVEPSNGANHQ